MDFWVFEASLVHIAIYKPVRDTETLSLFEVEDYRCCITTSWTVTAPSPNVKALRTLETIRKFPLWQFPNTIEESHSHVHKAQIMNNII